MVEIKGLKINFGSREILRGVDWSIPPKSRVGLVGANGAGKTTLLRAIAGEADYDGVISTPKGLRVGYLPQDLVEVKDAPLLEYLRERAGLSAISKRLAECEAALSRLAAGSAELSSALAEHERLERLFEAKGGFDFETEARLVLKGLGFAPEKDASRATSEFSGGWKMRAALAALLLSHADLLLLDEPTNHLDTESMEWLEAYLGDYGGTIIAVSHDRRFLDKTVTSVAELANGRVNIYSCGYEKYLTESEKRRELLLAERARQEEKIEETERFIERFRYKATKARQVQSRVKRLEKTELIEADAPAKSVRFRFPECPRSGLEVVKASGLSKSYGEHVVFRGVNFSIERGERAALVGVNGAGKSTLLRLLNKSSEPTEGGVTLGLNVKKAYFSQESSQNLDYGRTVWQEVNGADTAMTSGEKRSLLGAFLFGEDDITKPVSVLSGGEKSRLALLKMLLSASNLLILDEPTNHLDYDTKELFQSALLKYGGTIIIVSHDRSFLDDLATRVMEIRDGALFDYRGNYSYFIEKRAAAEAAEHGAEKKDKKTSAASGGESLKERRREEAEERNRLYRAKKDYVSRMKEREEEIAAREARKNEVENLLCDASTLQNSSRVQELMIELKENEKKLSVLYEEWEELGVKIEAIK